MSVRRYYVDMFPYTIQEGDCTIVNTTIVVYNQNDEVVYEASFSGSSVRNPIDKPNSDAGALIALGRALSKAGKRLDIVGNGLNKHDEDVKAERIKQAKKPRPIEEVYDTVPPEVTVAALFDQDPEPEGEVYD